MLCGGNRISNFSVASLCSQVPRETREFELTDAVRVDSGVREGDTVTDYYDPMIAKMITRGEDRGAAIAEMQKALGELQIADLPNNVSFMG